MLDLSSTLNNRKDFEPVLLAWGHWARCKADMPKSYKSPLGKWQSEKPEDDCYLPIDDDCALRVDKAIAKTIQGDALGAKLIDYRYIKGFDALEIVLGHSKVFWGLFRKARLRLDLLTVIQVLNNLNDHIRKNLLQ